MVVLKHVLLATIATLAVATPAANQWGNPDSSTDGIAPQGQTNGGAAGGGGGSGEEGSWPKSGSDPSGDEKHSIPSGKEDGGDKHRHKLPRSWSKPNGAPDGAPDGPPAGAGEHGKPGDGTGSQDQGNWPQSGDGKPGDEKPPGMDGDGGGNQHNQHHSRDEPKHRGFDKGKWNGPKKENNPDISGDHEHHRRDALESRDPSPSWDLSDDDPSLVQLREAYFGGANGRDDQKDAARNGTEPGNHPDGEEDSHINRRDGSVKGITECMNQNFVAPCKYTPITSEDQCYNAYYGVEGSMAPDKGLCCTVYERRNCNDNGWQKVVGFRAPGIGDYGNSQFLLNEGLGDEGVPSVMCKFQNENTCPKPKSSRGGF